MTPLEVRVTPLEVFRIMLFISTLQVTCASHVSCTTISWLARGGPPLWGGGFAGFIVSSDESCIRSRQRGPSRCHYDFVQNCPVCFCPKYYRFLSTGNSIDGQSPETTTETNPVWWQIVLGSLQRGFASLFETSCERTPGFEFANPVCFASNGGLGRPVSRDSGP